MSPSTVASRLTQRPLSVTISAEPRELPMLPFDVRVPGRRPVQQGTLRKLPDLRVGDSRRQRTLSALPKQRQFPLRAINAAPRTLTLPYGTPQYVNVATLKKLAGVLITTQVLKKVARRWEFVPDDALIDLFDTSKIFRLGSVSIYS